MEKKYNVADPKYFDIKHLFKFLQKETRNIIDVKIKLKKGDKEITSSEVDKENDTDKSLYIAIQGNPNKIKSCLPDGWDFDGKCIVNKNKAEPDRYAVAPLNKSRPIKEVKDMSDIMYLLKLDNPDIALNPKGMDNLVSSKEASALKMDLLQSYGYYVDANTGNITNAGNVLYGDRQRDIRVDKADINTTTATNVGEDAYTLNNQGERAFGAGDSHDGVQVRQETQDEIASFVKENSDMLIAGAEISAFTFEEFKDLYNNYIITSDSTGAIKLQKKGGDEAGKLIEDPKIMARFLLMDTIVKSVVDNVNDRTQGTASEGEVKDSMDQLEALYNEYIKGGKLDALFGARDAVAEGASPNEVKEAVKEEENLSDAKVLEGETIEATPSADRINTNIDQASVSTVMPETMATPNNMGAPMNQNYNMSASNQMVGGMNQFGQNMQPNYIPQMPQYQMQSGMMSASNPQMFGPLPLAKLVEYAKVCMPVVTPGMHPYLCYNGTHNRVNDPIMIQYESLICAVHYLSSRFGMQELATRYNRDIFHNPNWQTVVSDINQSLYREEIERMQSNAPQMQMRPNGGNIGVDNH